MRWTEWGRLNKRQTWPTRGTPSQALPPPPPGALLPEPPSTPLARLRIREAQAEGNKLSGARLHGSGVETFVVHPEIQPELRMYSSFKLNSPRISARTQAEFQFQAESSPELLADKCATGCVRASKDRGSDIVRPKISRNSTRTPHKRRRHFLGVREDCGSGTQA